MGLNVTCTNLGNLEDWAEQSAPQLEGNGGEEELDDTFPLSWLGNPEEEIMLTCVSHRECFLLGTSILLTGILMHLS